MVEGATLDNDVVYHLLGTYKASTGQVKIYLNGELKTTQTMPTTGNVSLNDGKITLGIDYHGLGSGYSMNGNIFSSKIYNKVLTQSEVNHNYFGGSIVTNNLVFSADAGTPVSYENGSEKINSLTGSIEGDLENGTDFTFNNGGSWVLDGTDDYISFGNPSSMSNAQVTVTFWYNPTTLMNSTHNGVLNGKTPGGKFCLFWINGTTLSTQYKDNSGLSAADGGIWTRSNSPVSISANKWYFIQITGNETTNEWRVGVDLNVSTTSFSSQYVDPNPTNWLLGRRNGTAADHSQIASLQVYNRILSQEEIQQNYIALKPRFPS